MNEIQKKSKCWRLGNYYRSLLQKLEDKKIIKITNNEDDSITISLTLRNPFNKNKQDDINKG